MQLRFFSLIIIVLSIAFESKADLVSLSLTANNQKTDISAGAVSKVQFATYKKFKLYRLAIKASANLPGFKVADDSSAVFKSNATAALLYVDDLKGQLSLVNDQNLTRAIDYEYSLRPNEMGLQNPNCGAFNLNLRADKKLPPGAVLAFSCEKVGDKIVMAVSTLGTVDINSSSLNELDGKGETWRAFDLGTVKAEAATVLELGLSSGGQEFNLKILSKKIEDKKNEAKEDEKKQIIKVGLAYTMSTLAVANSYSDSSPGLFVSFRSKPLLWGLQLGAEFRQAFAADTPIAISSSDFKASLRREFLGPDFTVYPKVLFVNSKVGQAASNIDINVVSFGGGVGFSYYFSKRESLDLSYSMLSFGSEAVSSATNIQIGLNTILFTDYNFNMGIELQNVTGVSSGGNTIKADQTVILLGMGFD